MFDLVERVKMVLVTLVISKNNQTTSPAREVVESSPLEIYKNSLDAILCHMFWDDLA